MKNTSDLKRTQRKNEQHTKTDFFIAIQQDYSETRRPLFSLPHLIIGIKNCSLHINPNLEMQSDGRRSGTEPHPSRVLFIGPSKRLKDYYTIGSNT
jgi:hypothetical protein